jgi:signal transduction histidine kinase
MLAMATAGASILLSDRWPVTASTATAVGLVLAVQFGGLDSTQSNLIVNVSTVGLLFTTVVLMLACGAVRPLPRAIAGLIVFTIALQWGDLNPFPAMITIGPWVIGLMSRTHADLVSALQARSRELDAERDRYAAEAIRYERARVARELHDVIAHSMSVVVIQAMALGRLPAADRGRCDVMLAEISGLARQAESDVAGLAEMFDGEPSPGRRLTRAAIGELIAQTTSTGAPIELFLTGDPEVISQQVSTVLHRMLQESLTNAVKHASGAPITITVDCDDDAVRVNVRNAAAPANPAAGLPAGPQRHGGQHGIDGLVERITDLAGTFQAGPTSDGGWEVTARLPELSPVRSVSTTR